MKPLSGHSPRGFGGRAHRLYAKALADAVRAHLEHRQDKCPECKGHGADPLSDNVNWLPCKTCNGTGAVPPPSGGRNE